MNESDKKIITDWLDECTPTVVMPKNLAVSLHISEEAIRDVLGEFEAAGWPVRNCGKYFLVERPAEPDYKP